MLFECVIDTSNACELGSKSYGGCMVSNKILGAVVVSALIGLFVGWLPKSRGVAADTAVKVGPEDIGGVITSSKGPEAGVWVIAETDDFPTKFVRIVVTDDQGRYLVPDLPKANYKVWVRGYGLIDSSPVTSAS